MTDFLLQELFPLVLNMSVTAGIIIVVVLLAHLPLKKAPKVFSYGLWAVVLFRLLCPVSLSAGFSLLAVLDAPVKETASGTSYVEYVQPELASRAYPQAEPAPPGVSPAPDEGLPRAEASTAADAPAGPIPVITCVWLAGILLLLAYSAVSWVRLRRKLIGSVPLRGNVYLADYISCPFVMGVLRPKIYLPSSLAEKERAYIILHERHHIRRLDHIVKALAFAALCIHWFNPLVWVAFVLSGKDMEMSCDEAVVKKLGAEIRADYSASLLSLATGRRIIAGTPLAFGEGSTRSRIQNLLNWKKSKAWISLTAAAACVAVLVLCAVNPVSAAPVGADPDVSDPLSQVLPVPEHPVDTPEPETPAPPPAAADVPEPEISPSPFPDPEPEADPSPPAQTDPPAAAAENHEEANDTAQPDLPAATTFSAADVEFSAWALATSADTMTYEERLAWVQAGPVYNGSTNYLSLGEYREGEDCLAYLGIWSGVPHVDQYSLCIRFADGTEAGLPLPRSGGFGVAPPDSMEFQSGRLVYEIHFTEEAAILDGEPFLFHLAGTYHYEVDLAAKTVSLSVL